MQATSDLISSDAAGTAAPESLVVLHEIRQTDEARQLEKIKNFLVGIALGAVWVALGL